MIMVNNRPQPHEAGLTVQRLLERNRFTYRGIIVKIGGKVVEEEDYAVTRIPDGEDVKVIHICHGG